MREGKRKDEVEGGGGDWDGLGPLSYLSSLLPSSLSRQGPYGRKRGKGERNEEKSHTRSPSHSASATKGFLTVLEGDRIGYGWGTGLYLSPLFILSPLHPPPPLVIPLALALTIAHHNTRMKENE